MSVLEKAELIKRALVSLKLLARGLRVTLFVAGAFSVVVREHGMKTREDSRSRIRPRPRGRPHIDRRTGLTKIP